MSECNKHNLLLNINSVKNCCVFPNQGICKQFSEQQISQYCCTSCNMNGMPKGAYVGRKLTFQYTPESDCNWQWTRCNNIENCPCNKKRTFTEDNRCVCPRSTWN